MPIENNTVSWVRSANMQSEVVVSFAATSREKGHFNLSLDSRSVVGNCAEATADNIDLSKQNRVQRCRPFIQTLPRISSAPATYVAVVDLGAFTRSLKAPCLAKGNRSHPPYQR
jgi:hypothetical protein